MTLICPKCHTENGPGAKYCLECGLPLSGVNSSTRLCAEGLHTMDPDWAACPYCASSQASPGSSSGGRISESTITEGVESAIAHPDAPKRVGEKPPVSDAKGRRTTFGTPSSSVTPNIATQPTPSPRPGRRIVALLITYSWRDEGEVFPVYEGRNYLGGDPECEICIRADEKLSGRHAAIFYRGGYFEISDEKSMNGTFVNEKSIPLVGQRLTNYSIIHTGATTWHFLAVDPESAK